MDRMRALMALGLVGLALGCAVPAGSSSGRVAPPLASTAGGASTSPSHRLSPAAATLPPSTTPSPSPASSPAPTLPAGELPRTAMAEQDGVRVTIELERNPMPAGEVTRVTTTVRNIGRRTLHWLSDGCSTAVHVRGEMAVAWRPGTEHATQAQLFKDRVLGWKYQSERPGPTISFRPEAELGDGSYGCADIGLYHDIAPGKAIHDTRAWDGMAGLRWGLFPSGPVTLTGSFGYYWRGRTEPNYPDVPRIVVELEAWVTGGADETWLSPPEVVDAALRDEAFRAFLDTQDLGNSRHEILWYRPEIGAWEVGILEWHTDSLPMGTMHLVLVDPHSGAILDTVDRAWDEERDGIP